MNEMTKIRLDKVLELVERRKAIDDELAALLEGGDIPAGEVAGVEVVISNEAPKKPKNHPKAKPSDEEAEGCSKCDRGGKRHSKNCPNKE